MRCARRSGLSLIEVVAAIALLGSLLAATMTARSRLLRQQRRADQLLAVIQDVEALAHAWIQDPSAAVLDGAGQFGEEDAFIWRSTSRPADIPGLEALVVQVAVFDRGAGEEAPEADALLDLDFLVAEPDEPVDAAEETRP